AGEPALCVPIVALADRLHDVDDVARRKSGRVERRKPLLIRARVRDDLRAPCPLWVSQEGGSLWDRSRRDHDRIFLQQKLQVRSECIEAGRKRRIVLGTSGRSTVPAPPRLFGGTAAELLNQVRDGNGRGRFVLTERA